VSKGLIDTDVLLDVALRRQKFYSRSADVLRWAESGGQAVIAWHSISNCACLLKDEGREFLKMLLTIIDVAPVAAKDAHRALELPMKDLEDAMQATAALAWGADCIITRNLVDYRNSPIPTIDPERFLQVAERS
jgi:predicted nucleic acid-binding protein